MPVIQKRKKLRSNQTQVSSNFFRKATTEMKSEGKVHNKYTNTSDLILSDDGKMKLSKKW